MKSQLFVARSWLQQSLAVMTSHGTPSSLMKMITMRGLQDSSGSWFPKATSTNLPTNLVDVATTLATTMSMKARKNGRIVSLAVSVVVVLVLTVNVACHLTNPEFPKPDPSTYRSHQDVRERYGMDRSVWWSDSRWRNNRNDERRVGKDGSSVEPRSVEGISRKHLRSCWAQHIQRTRKTVWYRWSWRCV